VAILQDVQILRDIRCVLRTISRMEKQLRNKNQMAKRYQVSPRTIDNWMADGRLPYLKLGRKLIRFDADQCDEALQRFHVGAGARR
jgi:excisionase family DNA binding protein